MCKAFTHLQKMLARSIRGPTCSRAPTQSLKIFEHLFFTDNSAISTDRPAKHSMH